MPGNEAIIRELYAAAEGQGTDVKKFVSLFSEEGYMRDVPSGVEFRGQAIADSIAGLISAFPDVHREILNIHVAKNVVVSLLAPTKSALDELVWWAHATMAAKTADAS